MLLGGMLCKLPLKFRKTWRILRDNHDTRCVFIKTMHDTRTIILRCCKVVTIHRQQSICDSSVMNTGTRMHNHPLRLVYHKNIIILIEDIEGNRFRFKALEYLFVIFKMNRIPFLYLGAFLASLSIYGNNHGG